MKNPKVSVVMPVYNGEKYLRQAVNSILSQTFGDFELIIIDDGSNDDTKKIIASFKDKRIKIIRNKSNLGVAKSLNIGCLKARGEYIARCDCDDINLLDRLQKQVQFLEKHKDYVVVGSRFDLIDENGKRIGEKNVRKGYGLLPKSNEDIRRRIYFRNPISHPSVMMRKESLIKVGLYDEVLNGVEDYDLWFRLAKIGKLSNLGERLIKRRWHKGAISVQNHFMIELLALLVRLKNLPFVSFIGLDLAVGLLTFVFYRFVFIFLLFKGTGVPPEPDDSYFYLSFANNLTRVDSFESFRLFLYSLWINLINWVTHLGWEKSYYLNFYLGTVLMFIVLVHFLRKIESNLFKRIVLISFLGLYSGSGAYQGFYWVVPSFYQLLLFFILVEFLLRDNFIHPLWVLLFSLLIVFVHPSSILLFSVFLPFSLFYSLLRRRVEKFQIKRSLVLTAIGVTVSIFYAVISLKFPQVQSPESPVNATIILKNILVGKINLVSWPVIWREYFRLLFLNPLTGFVFICCLLSSWYLKNYKILAIYFSLLLLVLLSSLIPYGYRTLAFIWPFTFIILGYGLIGFYVLLRRNTILALGLGIFSFLAFFTLATGLNMVWTDSLNQKASYNFDRSCPIKLSQLLPEKKVYFTSRIGYYAFLTHNFPQSSALVLGSSDKIESGDVVVINESQPYLPHSPSGLEGFLANRITRGSSLPSESVVDQSAFWNSFAGFNNQNIPARKLLDCGFFKVVEMI